MLLKSLSIFALTTAAGSPTTAQVKDWRSDLHQLASTIVEKHAAPFHHLSRGQFNREVEALDGRLPTLDHDGFFVGIDALLNSIGDGHTTMGMPADAPRFGVEFRRFDGTYRLIAADPNSAAVSYLGATLTAVDGLPIAEVRRRLMALTPAGETQPLREVRAEPLIDNGVILHGLQIGPRSTVRYTLKDNRGHRKTLRLSSIPETTHDNWVRMGPHSGQLSSTQSVTCSILRDSTALYCNFRSYSGLAESGARLMQMLHSSGAPRLIIDMRENGGGNFCEGLKHVVEPIAADKTINQQGKLFVLIGARTFSAAMSNAVHFRELTNAILVGEPIGEKPNSYQEMEVITLPHTGWKAGYSTQLYQFAKGGENLVRPDFQVHESWDAFRKGRDAPLAYSLSYTNAGKSVERSKPKKAAAESDSCN